MANKVVIVGAGPAGLTAAYELQKAGVTDITVIEADAQVGGISKTIVYKGNRIDIGGHRFFSKSDWVMAWWRKQLPLAKVSDVLSRELRYKGQKAILSYTDENPTNDDLVMLLRSRLSRIYFARKFFDYPLKLNFNTFKKMGLVKIIIFGFGYIKVSFFPRSPELSLEDFLINRFGEPLYRQFFKEYTEKVWGVPCSEISASWGAQRIKGLSITRAIFHALKSTIGLAGKGKTETSLIESFLYPKLGPGQMWEHVAEQFVNAGGKLLLNAKVEKINIVGKSISSVEFLTADGIASEHPCDYLISTMPIKDLVAASCSAFSSEAEFVAKNLQYRDFITVGLLYKKSDVPKQLDDNWIYIQEPGVKVGRIQIFNNWSPYLVADSETLWLGLEFFCQEGDGLWEMSDENLKALAQREIESIGLVNVPHGLDAVVIKVPKAYPGYFGSAYENFSVLREELDEMKNLFLIGRNGMHRYNNQDHSMLTAKEAASQIVSGDIDKHLIWNINIDDEYHEEK